MTRFSDCIYVKTKTKIKLCSISKFGAVGE